MEIKLAGKIAQARAKLGSLQPDKQNKDQNYKYISADKVLERGGDVLAEFGVAIIPSVIDMQISLVERAGKSSRIDASLKLQFVVTDGEMSHDALWVGFGSDYTSPDKAVYKAITSGHKYFLMKLLNIGVGNEDGEHEAPEQSAKFQPVPSLTRLRPAQEANGSEPAELEVVSDSEKTLTDARAVKVTIGGKEVSLGEVEKLPDGKKRLEYLAGNSKNNTTRAAAQVILDEAK